MLGWFKKSQNNNNAKASSPAKDAAAGIQTKRQPYQPQGQGCYGNWNDLVPKETKPAEVAATVSVSSTQIDPVLLVSNKKAKTKPTESKIWFSYQKVDKVE